MQPTSHHKPICPLDGGEMEKSKEAKSNGIVTFIVFCIGFIMTLSVAGAIIGIPLMLIALHQGGKRRGLWVCKSCHHQLERKLRWNELG